MPKYKTVDVRTNEGHAQALRLQSKGWKVITGSLYGKVMMEKPDKAAAWQSDRTKNALMMIATAIQWETDGEAVDLPASVAIPDNVDGDEVADYLSDEYGYLVASFSLVIFPYPAA